MKFRPCIDIHNGKVKQIVGASLKDAGDAAAENFVSEKSAADYAKLYRKYGLKGGHVILLNGKDSSFYEETKRQAFSALSAYPGGLQAGGGITAENAAQFLEAGASHVIVTSYVFQGGQILEKNLQKLVKAVGKERLVLDVSCKKRADGYYIVTDRWQKETDIKISLGLLEKLSAFCDEFLVHAVDVEGKRNGMEEELLKELAKWQGIPITYAGGVQNLEDLKKLKETGDGKIDVTIGSALSLFGGTLEFEDVVRFCREQN
ncbi:MAG: phosphoribosylformimino-5-aminoimidazole carboxamide ribotide isomerase [Lachnospiraceae bacterium]|nr:phosphoribosylformimino-5-aminoimidazole carboxamide ribotide isomerase [Lachnospiraceae bacterium]